jgi:hypothetical protein
LAIYRFTETNNAENVKVTQLTIHDAVNTGAAQFSNLTLWNGTQSLGSVGAASAGTPTVTTTGATSTIVVNVPTAQTETYQYIVTINGKTYSYPFNSGYPSTSLSTTGATSTTWEQANQVAQSIVSYLNGGTYGTFYGTTASLLTAATSTGSPVATVVVTSNATPAMSISVQGSDTTNVLVTNPVNNQGYTTTVANPGTTDYLFQIQGNPIIVPQGNSVSITLKGDASGWTTNATDNQTNIFSIATSSVTALGQSSNLAATPTPSPTQFPKGNTQTLLRSILTVSTAALGNSSSRAKNTTDDLGTITFAANNSGAVGIATTTITLSGSGASSTLTSLQLIDQNGNDVVVANEATSTITSTTTAPFSKTFVFTPALFQVSAGGSYTFKVRVNSLNIPSAGQGVSQSLSAAIQGGTDVMYSDGSANSSISLPTSTVPIQINSVSYGQGT